MKGLKKLYCYFLELLILATYIFYIICLHLGICSKKNNCVLGRKHRFKTSSKPIVSLLETNRELTFIESFRDEKD